MDEDRPKYGSNPYPVQVRVNILNTFTLWHITTSLFSVSNLTYFLPLRTNQMQQGSSLPTQAMFHGKLKLYTRIKTHYLSLVTCSNHITMSDEQSLGSIFLIGCYQHLYVACRQVGHIQTPWSIPYLVQQVFGTRNHKNTHKTFDISSSFHV